MDGARIFNAALALGTSVAALAAPVDSIGFCLSKGLGAPVGSVLCGTSEFTAKARRMRRQLGGGMRQAGVLAAAGIYALEHMVERLADDHANARRLAEGLVEAEMPVDLVQVETNFVLVDVGSLGLQADDAIARLRAEGVLLSFAARKDVLRAVAHLDVSTEDVEQAIERIPRALTGAPVAGVAESAPSPY
jgi:threonine aldolase